jgi:hypothetical protein
LEFNRPDVTYVLSVCANLGSPAPELIGGRTGVIIALINGRAVRAQWEMPEAWRPDIIELGKQGVKVTRAQRDGAAPSNAKEVVAQRGDLWKAFAFCPIMAHLRQSRSFSTAGPRWVVAPIPPRGSRESTITRR